ncbi:MAG: hypothetical protein ACKPKO_15095, partial [Candidatus Fonsibacter sp.]
ITLNYNTFISQYQTVSNQSDFAINITMSLTRLKSVFVPLWKNYQSETRQDMRANRQFNDFFSPMSQNTVLWLTQQYADGEFEFHMQIGSKMYPEYPSRSHAEAFYQLRKTLGFQATPYHATNITGSEDRERNL